MPKETLYNKYTNNMEKKKPPLRTRQRVSFSRRVAVGQVFLGAVVEEVRTIFERRNDATIYIPDMQSIAVLE